MKRNKVWHCRACRGAACKGGGNLDCAQRDPRPAQLYGILDTYGGLRFVVTADDIERHARCDETAICVPNLTVHEPIAWGDIPIVVARIELTVEEWIERGIPNEPHAREAVRMYRLRQKEQPRRSLDLGAIVET